MDVILCSRQLKTEKLTENWQSIPVQTGKWYFGHLWCLAVDLEKQSFSLDHWERGSFKPTRAKPISILSPMIYPKKGLEPAPGHCAAVWSPVGSSTMD